MEDIMTDLLYDLEKPTRVVLPDNIAIMVVEWDQEIRETMVSYIRETVGFISIGAWSGEEAVMILQKGFQIDLMITDLSLPGMCGEDLTKKVTSKYEFPVILMTGDPSYAEREALEAGASIFIRKPIVWEKLNEIIKNLVPVDEI